MATTIDYAAVGTRRPLDHRLGYVASAVSPVVTVAVVYLSHDARVNMVLARGEWCGTPILHAQTQLINTGFLLLISATALFIAWRAGVGLVVCRASLVVAAAMYLFYVVSAVRLGV
jgi:hypothetical protein